MWPGEGVEILRAIGHDVVTVLDQQLGGKPDPEIFAVVQAEGRALILGESVQALVRALRHARMRRPSSASSTSPTSNPAKTLRLDPHNRGSTLAGVAFVSADRGPCFGPGKAGVDGAPHYQTSPRLNVPSPE
jgi:hypothetical protein